MKNVIILLSLIFSSQLCIAQTINIDSCGLDSEAYLNRCEIEYFNRVQVSFRKKFDFKNKKIAFAYGNSGKELISKKVYFERWGKYFEKDLSVLNQLYILTPEEKATTGGYDAIIVSRSKLPLSKKDKKAIIGQLKNQE